MPPDQPEQLAIPAVEKAPVLEMRDFSQSFNNSYSNGVLPGVALRYATNMYSDPLESDLGALVSRDGVETWLDYTGDGGASLGLFAIDTNKIVIAETNAVSTTYVHLSDDGGALDDIGGTPFNWHVTLNTKIRFEQYIGYTFACNGTYIKSWDGDTANNWGATNLTSAPTGSLIKQFQGKLYVSGNSTYPSRVYFSSLPNVSGVLDTWDTTNNYFDVAPDDGDFIVALERQGNILLIYKQKSIYTWAGNDTSLSLLSEGIGAVTQEAVTTFNGRTFFLSLDRNSFVSLYIIDGGGVPQKLPHNNWLNSYLPNVNNSADVLCWNDNKNFYVSLGQGVVRKDFYYTDGVHYNSDGGSYMLGLKYNPSLNNYDEIYLPGGNPKHATQLINDEGSYVTLIAGDAWNDSANNTRSVVLAWHNKIGTKNYRDETHGSTSPHPIQYFILTNELEFTSRARIKQLNKFAVFARGNYSDATVSLRTNGGEWVPLGTITDDITIFSPEASGYYFEVKITGSTNDVDSLTSNTGVFMFEGFSFFDVTIESYEI